MEHVMEHELYVETRHGCTMFHIQTMASLAHLRPATNGISAMASKESLFCEDTMLYPLHPAHAPKLTSIMNAVQSVKRQ